MVACRNQTVFKAFTKAYSSYLRRIRLFYLPIVFLEKFYKVGSAPKRYHSFFLSVNKNRLNFNLSLILFSLHPINHFAASAKHQKLDNKR